MHFQHLYQEEIEEREKIGDRRGIKERRVQERDMVRAKERKRDGFGEEIDRVKR